MKQKLFHFSGSLLFFVLTPVLAHVPLLCTIPRHVEDTANDQGNCIAPLYTAFTGTKHILYDVFPTSGIWLGAKQNNTMFHKLKVPGEPFVKTGTDILFEHYMALQQWSGSRKSLFDVFTTSSKECFFCWRSTQKKIWQLLLQTIFLWRSVKKKKRMWDITKLLCVNSKHYLTLLWRRYLHLFAWCAGMLHMGTEVCHFCYLTVFGCTSSYWAHMKLQVSLLWRKAQVWCWQCFNFTHQQQNKKWKCARGRAV